MSRFRRALNAVRPTLIRVEADEVTYNLHILIRFELERALMSGELSTVDLPGAWDDAYESLLGIRPDSAASGVLQDVHWSAGLIGYFPTYTLGNLAAAQLFHSASESMLIWSKRSVEVNFTDYADGCAQISIVTVAAYCGSELIEMATGKPLMVEPLIQSLRTRYLGEFRIIIPFAALPS